MSYKEKCSTNPQKGSSNGTRMIHNQEGKKWEKGKYFHPHLHNLQVEDDEALFEKYSQVAEDLIKVQEKLDMNARRLKETSNKEIDHHYKLVYKFKALRMSNKKQKKAQTLIKSWELIKGIVTHT